MDDERKLGWAQRNRGKATRLVQAGAVVEDLAEQVYEQGVRPAAEIASCLTRLGVDEEFCRHCSVAEVRNGRVVIHVDQAELVYVMQRRWHDVLRETLPSLYRGCKVGRVVFEFGSGGVHVGGSSV